MAIEDEYDQYGNPKRLLNKRKLFADENPTSTTPLTIQELKPAQPQVQAPPKKTVFQRVGDYLMPKKEPMGLDKMQAKFNREMENRENEQRILNEAKQRYKYMKYIPSFAQSRFKKMQPGAQKLYKQLTTVEGLYGSKKNTIVPLRKPPTKDASGKIIKGKIIGYKKVQKFQPGIASRGVQTMQAMPGRVLRAGKKIEYGTKKHPGYAQYRETLTGIAGMLFPMTNLSQQSRVKGQKRGRPGRPAQVYKHISPITGQPVHVYEYRKHVRAVKRRAAQMTSARENAVAKQMMRRGLPPQMAYAQAERLNQLRAMQAMQEAEEAPGMQEEGQMAQYSQPQQTYQPQPQQQARQHAINMLGPDRQMQQHIPQGMKREISFFNSNVGRVVPVNDKSERWANDQSRPEQSSFNRPDTLGFRRKPMQGGYY